ncbi:MAG: hypothetical protein HY268_22130 [Deltaproteobacteria bacterium]|nr:hypothetical protein [Deltaproteobacteria bacterium]
MIAQTEQLRNHMAVGTPLSSEELLAINFFDPSVNAALIDIMVILHDRLQDSAARAIYRTIAEQWVSEWEKDREENSRRHSRRRRDFHREHEISQLLSGFVMNLDPLEAEHVCKPVLDAASRFPKKVADLLLDLTLAEDQTRNDDTYWALWQAIADNILGSEYFVSPMNGSHSDTQTLIQISLCSENLRTQLAA